MARRLTFRQSDIQRVIRAFRAEGVPLPNIKIAFDGAIETSMGAPAPEVDEDEVQISEFIRKLDDNRKG